MEPGPEGGNYPESLGNTFAVATMAGKDEASKQKSESISKDLLPFLGLGVKRRGRFNKK